MSAHEALAERVFALSPTGEDARKQEYVVEQLLSTRADLGATVLAAGDLLRHYDRSSLVDLGALTMRKD